MFADAGMAMSWQERIVSGLVFGGNHPPLPNAAAGYQPSRRSWRFTLFGRTFTCTIHRAR